MRRAFIAAIGARATSFPVVNAHASDPQSRFSIKSAAGSDLVGFKVGAYFPTNNAQGLPRHTSTIMLIDQTTGKIGALIEGSVVNCYRTAAADAVATDALARLDAEVLILFGTGHPAAYEVQAVARVRQLSRVLVVGRDASRTAAFVDKLCGAGLPAQAAAPEIATRTADMIVTATTATAPLFTADWVRAGTHISSMGSDARGKQELTQNVFASARLFCDLPEQSAAIGKFQHADPDAPNTAIGAVLSGAAIGRRSSEDITVFDSSGISLRDLNMAKAILEAVKAQGGT